MKYPIKVRLADVHDAATLADFTRSIASETEQVELNPQTVSNGVQAVFENPGLGFYVVATLQDEIVGCLMVRHFR
ncbi:MAG: hypothetical protein OXI60_12425 [Acidiferrobacterales bacterium]|nr:hypothetical protein [Acidiferrobacterales bacterium]